MQTNSSMSKPIQKQIEEFLNKFAKKDSPDMDDSIVELLMDDHFYYIDYNMQGWYIKEDVSTLANEEEKEIHKYLLNLIQNFSNG